MSSTKQMVEKERHRVKFYSRYDGAATYELKRAEEILTAFLIETEYDINDLLEFYNIKLYFDNSLFHPDWNSDRVRDYLKASEDAYDRLKEYLVRIEGGDFQFLLKKVDFNYYSDLWDVVDKLSIHERISPEDFDGILSINPNQIYQILTHRRIVKRFDRRIRNFLLEFDESAQILLSGEERKSFGENFKKYHFPSGLSSDDKEVIINSYLDREDPNLNYVRLIVNAKDSELKLSARTRLKAKNKARELNDQILKKGHTWETGVMVSLSDEVEGPMTSEVKDLVLHVTYSRKLLDQLSSDLEFFYAFRFLFQFVDKQGLIAIVSKPSETGSFERIFMRSKNEYPTGDTFSKKEILSHLQLLIFEDYLRGRETTIESVIEAQVTRLNELVSPAKFMFQVNSTASNYAEKIKVLAPNFEFLLKQFNLFAREKEIDLELIQIDTTPVRLSELQSLSEKKYFYSDSPEVSRLLYLFFSDQSHLFYVEPFKGKYRSLFDLLNNETVNSSMFESYQMSEIQTLIDEGYLKTDSLGNVVFGHVEEILILHQLHQNGVLNYWHHHEKIRIEIDRLVEKGVLKCENTLFTIQEKNYFNYYLNKKEYTNGYDLRNKYLHGTHSLSDEIQKADYFRLLKIIILTLIKIENDILIWRVKHD